MKPKHNQNNKCNYWLVGRFFLLRIIGIGDDEIKMAATVGDFGAVSPLVELARIVLIITVSVTLIFTLLGLFSVQLN